MKFDIRSLPILILLFVLWISPGLFGRDPWKADEPYTFGLVNTMIQSGDWVIPRLTGEPFLEKPPIYFMTAAVFGSLFSPPLVPFEAARLATVVFMFLALLFFGLAARELYGGEYAVLAALLLVGCVHLQVTAHKLITDVALFTGFSIGLYGYALILRRPFAGGFWLGTGTGLGFLSKGLLAPGILGVAGLALLLFPRWRRRDYFVALGTAVAAALPWLIIWPAALYRRSTDLFTLWFWRQNFGRFLGFNDGSVGFNAASLDSHSYYVLNLVWLAWPVILPALWTLWHFRRSWRTHPVFQAPLVLFLVFLGVLSAASTNRTLYAVPMLLPIAMIAAAGSRELPVRAKTIANRISVLFFGFLAVLLWISWLALMTGTPAGLARKLQGFRPDYVPQVQAVLLIVAVLYTVAWLVVVWRFTRGPEHVVLNWTLGVILTWALIMTLWLPALNSGTSHRAAFLSLRKAVPEGYSCLALRGVGESERGMLEYFTGLRARRIEIADPDDCGLLLDERPGKAEPSGDMPGWSRIWEFRHPSIRPKDVFTLYRKNGKP